MSPSQLHTIHKSPFQNKNFEICLSLLNKGDAVLLIEDGVYAAITPSPFQAPLEKILEHHAVYALVVDLQTRGLTHKVHPKVRCIDDKEFVTLTLQYDGIHAWK